NASNEASKQAQRAWDDGRKNSADIMFRNSDDLYREAQEQQQKLIEKQTELNEKLSETAQTYRALAVEVEGLSSSDADWISKISSESGLAIEDVEELSNKIVLLKQSLGEDFSFTGLES